MRTYTGIVAASLFLLQHAAAQPTVDIDEPDRASLDRLEEVDGKWVIELSTPPGAFDDHVLITIKASTEEPIGSITVDALSHPQADVRLRVLGKEDPYDLPSVDLITTTPESTGWVILLELQTSGDLGSVNVADLGPLVHMEGDLTGNITLTNPPGRWGSPTLLRIDGDMFGDFTLDNGVIRNITVLGDIGTPTSPVTISCDWDNPLFVHTIELIQAANIYAHIDADAATPNDGTGSIRRLYTSGEFKGSLHTEKLYVSEPDPSGGINILGDLKADITVAKSVMLPIRIEGDLGAGRTIDIGRWLLNDDEDEHNGTIEIGGSLKGIIRISTDPEWTNGLKGRVIANKDNVGGTWTGAVIVGTPPEDNMLSPTPYYDELSANVGDGAFGAVGLAPFNFHPKESKPEYMEPGLSQYNETSEVLIWHYGPVFADGAGAPLKVEEATMPFPISGPIWIDKTSDYNFVVESDSHQRLVSVTRVDAQEYPAERAYRFQPDPDVLKCYNVTGAPAAAYKAPDDPNYPWYEFRIYHKADMNKSGLVDATDLIIWQSDPIDINNDIEVDGTDLADLLDAIAGG